MPDTGDETRTESMSLLDIISEWREAYVDESYPVVCEIIHGVIQASWKQIQFDKASASTVQNLLRNELAAATREVVVYAG